jgi:hypothetical protein
MSFIIKTVQREVFSTELHSVTTGMRLSTQSDILPLSPVLDHNNILRVGGRVKHAKVVTEHLQPIIIPKKHHLALLLVRHFHELTFHQGRHITEGALRSAGYWVIGRT